MVIKLTHIFSKLKRAFDYARFGYNNYDWDYSSVESYILFKLKRIQHQLLNGPAIHEDNSLKALKLSIKLLERLNKADYNKFYDLHSKKWGELKSWSEPVESGNKHSGSYWRSSRPNANTEEEKKQERIEFKHAMDLDHRREVRDRDILYKLLNKYIRYWWD